MYKDVTLDYIYGIKILNTIHCIENHSILTFYSEKSHKRLAFTDSYSKGVNFNKYYLQICGFNEKSKLCITRRLQYQIQIDNPSCLYPSYDWFISMLAAWYCV